MPLISAFNNIVPNSFTIIQPDHGTSPVADDPNDTLTFTSSDSTVNITGNSSTDTIDFKVASTVVVTGSWARPLAVCGG